MKGEIFFLQPGELRRQFPQAALREAGAQHAPLPSEVAKLDPRFRGGDFYRPSL